MPTLREQAKAKTGLRRAVVCSSVAERWTLTPIYEEDAAAARTFLETWCRDAFHSVIKQLVKFARTLGCCRTVLIKTFKHLITSTMVEEINNKIKTLKRQAYGLWDKECFTLRLYHLHTQRYSLTGSTLFASGSAG